MSTAARAVTRAVSTSFGMVMVASAAVQADRQGLVAAVVAAATVLVGSVFRPAATIAVLLTVCVLVLADAPPVLTATSGLCAAAYLVLRHTTMVTSPTVLGAVGFTAAGLAAASLPIQLPWVPLLAPVAVLALYVVVTRPFWAT
ncbi:MAG TPA: hypothetical protein VKA77_10185 [Mycobacterium sp.]|jgi:hypothetical protein|nr:hypothetical protein [Mycobacterium sp.]